MSLKHIQYSPVYGASHTRSTCSTVSFFVFSSYTCSAQTKALSFTETLAHLQPYRPAAESGEVRCVELLMKLGPIPGRQGGSLLSETQAASYLRQKLLSHQVLLQPANLNCQPWPQSVLLKIKDTVRDR